MKDLSVQQGRTLTIVACLTLLHGKSPTLRQLAGVLGCSRPAVHYRLHYLEKKGFWSAARWGLTPAGLEATRPIVDRAIAGLTPGC